MIRALKKDMGQACERVMRSQCRQVFRGAHICRMRQGDEPGVPLWAGHSGQSEQQVQML